MERTDERALLLAHPQHDVDLTRPTIAWDIARIAAVADALTAAVDDVVPGKITFVGTCRVAGDVLRERTTGVAPAVTSRDVVIAELVRCAALALHRTRRTSARMALERRIKSGQLAGDLVGIWASTPADNRFEPILDSLVARMVDAETLAAAVIGYESQRHINLIWLVANRLVNHFPDRTASDLFGWGYMGLRVALRNYNPNLGFKFSTYACQRISGQIRDGVRQENPIPKRLTTLVRKVARVEEDLTSELGRPPQLAEVARRMVQEESPEVLIDASLGKTPELADATERIEAKLAELKILPRLAQAASVEEMTGSEHATELGPLTDDTDPADVALQALRREAILDAIAALPAEDAEAVRLLMYEGRTVAEVRELTGASAQQLRRRCDRGRKVLAESLAEWAEVA